MVLELLGIFEDGKVLSEAEKRLKAHLDGSSPLVPDLRSVVYALGVHNAKLDLYESLLNVS